MYCNHEENIKEAYLIIENLIREKGVYNLRIISILESMINDAIAGHGKLEKILQLLEQYDEPEDLGDDYDPSNGGNFDDCYKNGVKYGYEDLAKEIRYLIKP